MRQRMTSQPQRSCTWLYVLLFLLVVMAIGCLYVFYTINGTSSIDLDQILRPAYGQKLTKFTTSSTPVNVALNRKVQSDRVRNVHETCRKYREIRDTPGYKGHKSVFYATTKYNWSYCKIGKIGSTLWTQFFYILHHEGDIINDVLTKCREDIHNLESIQHLILGVEHSKSNTTRMIVSARNPYTRLFSAYIDRMFIPSTSISVRGDKDPKCKSQISFPEFLQFVINNTKEGIFDYHWSPVFYLCKPCEINPAIIFKQETFKMDFHYVVNQTVLEPYKLDVLSKAMAQQSNWSGFALVDDVLDYITPTNQRHTLDCQTWEQITHRLWEAFIIQGFISEKAPFPSGLYQHSKDYEHSNIFRQALIDARKNYPMTKTGMSLQRRAYMTKYYSTVNQEIIEGIKDVYSVDFDMFGYNYEPPVNL